MVSQALRLRGQHTGYSGLTDDVLEYHNKTITRLFGGNAHLGCYFLAMCIFSAGMLRDQLCVHFPPPFLYDCPASSQPTVSAT
jgi:hypothetical protein